MANEAIERAVQSLIDSGRISRDLKNEYVTHLESQLQNEILRGADYTNKTKALAAEKRQIEESLAQERARLNSERAKLAQWQDQVSGQLQEYDRVMKELPSLTAKISAYEQALNDFQIMDRVQVPNTPAIPSITDRREPQRSLNEKSMNPADVPFLTRDAAAGALREFAVLTGKMSKIQAQHQKLFNEPLDDDLISHFFETGQDPEEHWRVKYNVEGKRNEIAARNREAEIAKMREDIRTEIMQSLALDPSRIVGGQGQQYKGGLTPVLENYAQSRALAHNGIDQSQPKADDFIPPEKKPDIAASRDRVNRAAELFAKNFDVVGRPLTDHGREMARKYSSD